VAEIGEALADTDTLFALDTVTSLAGVDVRVDDWHVDACYAGTQKCLSVPPGLSPVTFSDRAVERIRRRRHPVQSWYLDVTLLLGYLDAAGGRTYHHTAPISMLYGLRAGLALVLEEGLDARIARHARLGAQLQDGLRDLGLDLLAQEGHRLPQLTTVGLPDGVDEAAWRRRCSTSTASRSAAGSATSPAEHGVSGSWASRAGRPTSCCSSPPSRISSTADIPHRSAPFVPLLGSRPVPGRAQLRAARPSVAPVRMRTAADCLTPAACPARRCPAGTSIGDGETSPAALDQAGVEMHERRDARARWSARVSRLGF
jgi:hypothetical protein